MGAAETDSKAADVERPQHAVTLDAFWIDRTEVTNAQVAQCAAAGACTHNDSPGETEVASLTRTDYYLNPDYANYPALIFQAFEARITARGPCVDSPPRLSGRKPRAARMVDCTLG